MRFRDELSAASNERYNMSTVNVKSLTNTPNPVDYKFLDTLVECIKRDIKCKVKFREYKMHEVHSGGFFDKIVSRNNCYQVIILIYDDDIPSITPNSVSLAWGASPESLKIQEYHSIYEWLRTQGYTKSPTFHTQRFGDRSEGDICWYVGFDRTNINESLKYLEEKLLQDFDDIRVNFQTQYASDPLRKTKSVRNIKWTIPDKPNYLAKYYICVNCDSNGVIQ